jgi:EAL domain-containing protein (putative c-di-GMP-specific phosphodiesterase class I)
MAPLYRLNALQLELREALSLQPADYRLQVDGGEVKANYVGLQLRSAFQPIVDLRSHTALGYEALLRATDQKSHLIEPPAAFRQAELAQSLVKFDRLCRTLHTLNYLNLAISEGLLFLNVHPDLLVAVNAHGKVFERVLHQHDVSTQNIVIEINESSVSEIDLLQLAIDNYRQRGYQIAVDNFGKKHFNLERLWQLSPAFVKLDRRVIQLAETESRLQKILPKLVAIITDLGAQVVAVGVENVTQLSLVQSAGIHLVQGFLFDRAANGSYANSATQTVAVL